MTINDVINTDQQIESESKREFRISVRSLWKVFGSEPDLVKEPEHILKSKSEIQDELGLVVALRDVDFDVYEGETFVVMGLSGSGKSTLVRCLIRLIEPSSGEIYVDDEDIINLNDKGLTTLRRKKNSNGISTFRSAA